MTTTAVDAPSWRVLAVAGGFALTVVLALVGAGASAVAGMAASLTTDEVVWGIRPADTEHGSGRPNFAYAADPGEVIEDALVVTNRGEDDLTLAVYAADGFTSADGQLELLPADEASVDLGAWTVTETDSVTLAPGESREIGFTVSVPADARPGDHAGGIVTSLVSATPDTNLTLDRRSASRIHLRVSGDLVPEVTAGEVSVVYNAAANPFGPADVTVRYTLTNTGNVRVVAHESAVVRGPFGWGTVAATPTVSAELLPGSSIDQAVRVPGVWPVGRVQAEVSLTPEVVGIGGGNPVVPVTVAGSAWAVPWGYLVIALLVAVLAIAVPRALRRRR